MVCFVFGVTVHCTMEIEQHIYVVVSCIVM